MPTVKLGPNSLAIANAFVAARRPQSPGGATLTPKELTEAVEAAVTLDGGSLSAQSRADLVRQVRTAGGRSQNPLPQATVDAWAALRPQHHLPRLTVSATQKRVNDSFHAAQAGDDMQRVLTRSEVDGLFAQHLVNGPAGPHLPKAAARAIAEAFANWGIDRTPAFRGPLAEPDAVARYRELAERYGVPKIIG